MPKFIEDDGILLPEFLFYFDDAKSRGKSPAASFNPASAIEGDGFEVTTSPSKKPVKRSIIIDESSLATYPEYGERVAFIKRLKIAGFKIFLRGKPAADGNVFHEIGDDLENISQLHNLSKFDESKDYNALATKNVTRDKSLIFGKSHKGQAKDVMTALTRVNYCGELSGNELHFEMRSLEELGDVSEQKPRQLVYFLSKSSPTQQKSAISRMYQRQLIQCNDPVNKVDPSYFIRTTGDLIRAMPHLQEQLLAGFVSTFGEEGKSWEATLKRSIKTSLSSGLDVLLSVIKVFPNQEDRIVDQYLADCFTKELYRDSFIFKSLTKLNSLFPHKAQKIIEILSSSKVVQHNKGAKEILLALLRRDEDRYDELYTKWVSEAGESLHWNEKYKVLFAFIEASPTSSLREFFEEKLLENFTKDYKKIYIDFIFSNSSPEMAEKILDVIQVGGEISPSYVIDAINALPERAQELVEKYQPFSTGMVLYRILDMPYGIRNNLIDIHKHTHAELGRLDYYSNLPYLTSEKDLKALNYSSKSGEESKPTYLNIVLNSDPEGDLVSPERVSFFTKLFEGRFVNVATMRLLDSRGRDSEIIGCLNYLSVFDSNAEITRRSIRHLILPKTLEDNQEVKDLLEQWRVLEQWRGDSDVSVEFEDYQNYLGVGEEIEKWLWKEGGKVSPAPKSENKIRIAQGATASEIEVKNSEGTPTFTMLSAGEVLNDSTITSPEIRQYVVKGDILHNLKQEEYVPQTFANVGDLKSLSAAEIEGFRGEASAGGVYYSFAQTLIANKRSRLLSADAAETFVGLIGDVSGITIEKGDDDFFYATSTTNRDLSYVTKAASPKSHLAAYGKISSNHPIKKIIDEYKDANKGYENIAPDDKKDVRYDPSNHAGSMERMFEERLGVCRHRVAAVKYAIEKDGNDANDVRSVCINGNHEVLEIKYNGKWISVELGGGNDAQTIEASEEKPYVAAEVEVVAPKQNLEEEKLSDLLLDRVSPLLVENKSDQSPSQVVQVDAEALAAAAAKLVAIERANRLALQKMVTKLLAVSELDKVEDAEDLKTRTVNSDKKKILIVTGAIEQHGNFLRQEAKAAARPSFYIDGPDKLDLHRTNLVIANDNKPTLREGGLLADFLKEAANNPGQEPLLVINWQAFSPKQKLALNTVIDKERRINGVEIDPSIQIIGLAAATSQDPSFLSRHDVSVASDVNLPKQSVVNSDPIQTIDLQGFPDWKRHLFGKVILQGDKMVWQESKFVEALESKESNFEITNLSPEAATKLQYEFAQAQAAGKITYHGYDIILPQNFAIKCARDSFDFSKFTDTAIARNATTENLPSDCHLINSQLFDYLLCDKSIDDSTSFYQEEEGLIERCAKTGDKLLKLFISSNLSDNQWYCLLYQAQEKGVKLELHLAPRIDLPSKLLVKEGEIAQVEESAKKTAQIFVSNDPSRTLENLREEEDIFAVVDVEDFSYQDLVERINFERAQDGFENFKKISSELLTQLAEGKKIVLKGEFSADLLQMIEPIITGKKPEFAEIADNLILIIENKSCEAGKVFEPLKCLPKSGYKVENHPAPKSAQSTTLEYFEKPNNSTDLSNSEEEAQAFIEERKKIFSNTLEHNSMLRLVGHSGVGKSRLLKEFETHDQGSTAIYRDLTAFEDWAKKDEDGKAKILFIDESNIEDRHFTMFSPLKEGGEQRIFYQGKFYDLDERHKVVFACNPAEYGGGRFEQKLFNDGEIPAIYLRDFPASYIYEKILRESIYEGLSEKFRSEVGEEDFKGICQPLIEEYQKLNSRKKTDKDAGEETVRELQEKLLIAMVAAIEPAISSTTATTNFVSTAATKEAEEALTKSLRIRANQRFGNFPNKAVGLNGVLFEGDSGTGKSELISAVFASQGITEKKIDGKASDTNDSKQQFYKIDANLPLDKKRAIIVKAFEEGNIVWIDEINSCIDDGLEKVLNAALTGDHPDGKTEVPKPGFMLVSSVNSIALEGRSQISPALRHRVIAPKMKNLKEYSHEDLTKIVKHWIEQDRSEVEEDIVDGVCEAIASHFQICLNKKGGENINLRMLRKDLPEILPQYCDLAKLEEASNLLKIMPKYGASKKPEEESKTPEVLEVQTEDFGVDEIENITNENAEAVEHLNHLRGGDSDLYLYRPRFQNKSLNSDSGQFDFSSTRDLSKDNFHKIVLESLSEVITECEISEAQAAAIILIAIKNGGIGNNKKLLELDLAKLANSEMSIEADQAMKFSKAFQDKMTQREIFTGNQNATEFVGKRLKRLTPDYALEILSADKSQGKNDFENLCHKLDIEGLESLIKPSNSVQDSVLNSRLRRDSTAKGF